MFRSVGDPIRVGLGTAAIIAMGAVGTAAPAWAAPGPSASQSPGPTPSAPGPDSPDSPGGPPGPTDPLPEPWGLEVTVTVPDKEFFEGDKVNATIVVKAEKATRRTELRLTAGGRPLPGLSRCVDDPCRLGEVGRRGKRLNVVLTVPKKIRSGNVKLTAKVSGDGAVDDTFVKTVEVRQKLAPKPSPSPRGNGDSNDTRNSGNGNTGNGNGNRDTPYTPPLPNGEFNPNTPSPDVNLPPVTAPSLAPKAMAPAPQTALRSNDSPNAQELEFKRAAGTQVAWLAALLVAVSLLLTQLRLRQAATSSRRPPRPNRRRRRPTR
ncbi:hypothetical protein [Thermomonospora umbrina]|uniref:Uncharacterized protein n=1 Tax=Thermomonospora umbrina TaxID=111806 RepID=A0A3D9SIP9_9ACTN|nr:hypothetical protein [Thermomonospora umbrina]REE95808.1 hypothetical protein DFJ69_1219 [Thermomonospora umbrina]